MQANMQVMANIHQANMQVGVAEDQSGRKARAVEDRSGQEPMARGSERPKTKSDRRSKMRAVGGKRSRTEVDEDRSDQGLQSMNESIETEKKMSEDE